MTIALRKASIACACAATLVALSAREVHSSAVVVVATAGLVGLIVAGTRQGAVRAPAVPSAAVAAVGMAAFGLTSVLWTVDRAPRAAASAIAATVVAAIAEEAFFRQGVYVVLERYGAAVAVTATAAAFALVHVPLYGWRAAGLDFAAGLVFGWQRWATGRWSVPAATHAFANLVAVL